MSTARRLKVGAVNYLNTKPLVYELGATGHDFDLIFDFPSRLADDLAASKLDVALIPTIEFFRDPTYSVVSDACIGCRGPVLSVKLFSRKPVQEIQTLALDEGSRTSAALVQILLRERFGLAPALEPLSVDSTLQSSQADAVLLIGDRAIHSPSGNFATVWDLGDEWCRWSELPFVFAMWTARPGIELGDLEEVLSGARDEGVSHLSEIADREAAPLGLTRPQCLAYLRDNLHFTLGPRERAGLELFYNHAVSLGLAPPGVTFGFRDSAYSR